MDIFVDAEWSAVCLLFVKLLGVMHMVRSSAMAKKLRELLPT